MGMHRDYISRTLDLSSLLKNKSYFLFGPRATGKSMLIANQLLDQALVLDLLENELFLRLNFNPDHLEALLPTTPSPNTLVVIDEVQRIPELLNTVHRLIEKHAIKFLLTGSSARKLKYNQANLLAGRARQAELFPLTYHEIPEFDLDQFLLFGGLPIIHLSDAPYEDLLAYVNTYLKEEIQTEALVRKLPAFHRFLKYSALSSGDMLNFANIANDSAVPANTVRSYYQILEDTFLGFMLPAWTKTTKRKAITKAKFYFFDLGVRNCLANIRHIQPESDQYGQAFEQFIALELRAYNSYHRLFYELHYWQAKNGQEVDFIIDNRIAIEVKATHTVQKKHLKGLLALQEEGICEHYYLVSQDKFTQQISGIECLHWQTFLEQLWGNLITGL